MPPARILALCLVAAVTVASWLTPAGPARAYVIHNWWPDATNIVMDEVLLPANVWSLPAQFQMSDWNEVDTADASHPFRVNGTPRFAFGANDDVNTIGFLGEADLGSEYGLSYATALAWTVCWAAFFSGRLDECDVMLNAALPWNLAPDPQNWFQSTVLHELGHVRGLGHENRSLSMQNSGVDKLLRGATLYMDDRAGVRENASHVAEVDIAIYNKYHTGTVPAWMTASRTTARAGETITFRNITVENRGAVPFGPLRFGAYMSSNTVITTDDELVASFSYSSFPTFSFNTFDVTVTVPPVTDCGDKYFGGIIDDVRAYTERYENNNTIVFSNGSPAPQPIEILLARDPLEPNDAFASARAIALPFSHASLSLDSDADQDFYRFTLTQAARVTASISFDHSLGDADLELRNSSNAVIASSTGTGNGETITRVLAPGTYTVRVYGVGPNSCNRYSMNVASTPASLEATVTANQSTFAPGEVLVPTFVIDNPGLTVSADFYAGLLRPDGSVLFYTGGGLVAGHRNSLATYRPVAAGISLAAPFSVTIPGPFSYTWTGSEPTGSYAVFLLVVTAGALADGALTAADVLAFATASVSFPPVVACNDTQVAGGDTPDTRFVAMNKSTATFRFDYNTFTQQDRIVVSYQGGTLLDTGCVGASGSQQLSYSGTATGVSVQVIPNCAGGTGTAWNYTVHCPNP